MNLQFRAKDYLSFGSHAAFGSSLRNWLRLHSENNFDIDPRFIPKILFITAGIVSSTPLRVYERWRYNEALKNVNVKQPLFILGYYRSGTTFLHYLLAKDPRFAFSATYQVMLPHIFLSSENFSKNIMSAALPGNRPMDNLKMGAELPKEEEFALAALGIESLAAGYFFPKKLKEYFDNYVLFSKPEAEKNWKRNMDFFLKKVSYRFNEKSLVIKSPANTARIKQILELYPDARFLHIYRNPYTVYLSNERLYEKILPMLAFHKTDNKTIEEFIFHSYRETYRKFFDEKKRINPINIFEFSYEEFVASPIETLRKAYAHLRYKGFETLETALQTELENYRNYETNKFNLATETKNKIYENWKAIFERLGYGK